MERGAYNLSSSLVRKRDSAEERAVQPEMAPRACKGGELRVERREYEMAKDEKETEAVQSHTKRQHNQLALALSFSLPRALTLSSHLASRPRAAIGAQD